MAKRANLKTRIPEMLMQKDPSLTLEDAYDILAGCRHEASAALERGADWETVEGIIEDWLGLEMDVITDIF